MSEENFNNESSSASKTSSINGPFDNECPSTNASSLGLPTNSLSIDAWNLNGSKLSPELDAVSKTENSNCTRFHIDPNSFGPQLTLPSILLAAWTILTLNSDTIDSKTNESECDVVLAIKPSAPSEETVTLQIQVNGGSAVSELVSTLEKQWFKLMAHRTSNVFSLTLYGSRDNSSFANGASESHFSVSVTISWEETGHCNLTATPSDDSWRDEACLIMSRYERIVQQINGDLLLTVSGVDLFSRADMATIQNWNGSCAKQIDDCVHRRFEEAAVRAPESVAVDAWDGTFTYVELAQLSSRFALILKRLSIGSGDLVPLCFEKSKWTVVAILGVLKSGAGYVPLSPNYPAQRIQEICKQVKARIVVSSESQSGAFDQLVSTRLLVVNRGMFPASSDRRVAFSKDFVASNAASEDTFCVIFTSGSTGNPKGVVLHHAAILSSAVAHGTRLGFDENTRSLQFAAYTFDVSVMEIFTTLIFGGCVCIPSDEDRLNHLPEAITRMRCNWSFLTPSVARLLKPQSVPMLAKLTLGGEPVSLENIKAWSSRELSMVYAPSECTVLCQMHPGVTVHTNPSSLGRPCGGQTYIVDPMDYTKLMPIGAIGELLITGPIVGRGYLEDSVKTMSVFKSPPSWCTDKNERGLTYRSGDLVKYAKDGSVLYVARKDTQVKLHGQRLELREIESALASHASIIYCAAILPTEGPYRDRLCAVFRPQLHQVKEIHHGKETLKIIPVSSLHITSEELRDCLLSSIPPNLIPTIWIALQDLPLTLSGKIDRVGLKTWLNSMIDATPDGIVEEPTSVLPGTKMETVLQQICAEVLNMASKRIILDSSFIRLGGDSITAMQLVSALRRAGFALTVQKILQSKTLRDMAAAASRADIRSFQSNDSEEIDVPFELAPIQKMHFQLRPEGGSHHNQGFMISLSQEFDIEAMNSCMEALVSHHSMLRARFQWHEGSWTQKLSPDIGSSFSIRFHDVRDSADVVSIVEASNRQFDISNGPIFAADVFNVAGETCQKVFLNAHHLVMDLVSWRIVLGDLEDLLRGKSLPDSKTVSFQAWSKLQAEHSRSAQNASLTYHAPPNMDFKEFWEIGDVNVMGDVHELRFELSQNTTELLLNHSNQSLSVQPIDIQLATLAGSFIETFLERDCITIFNEGHGREPWAGSNIDLSRTVGWFTTMFPFVFSRTEDLLEHLKQAKRTRITSPDKGRAHFAARHYKKVPTTEIENHEQMEVVFNYQGSYQQLEREDSLIQRMPWGALDSTMHAPNLPRYALLEIETAIDAGQFKVICAVNRKMKDQKRIEKWMSRWMETLEETCQLLVNMKPTFTVADFPALRLEEETGFLKLLNNLKVKYKLETDPGQDIVDIVSCTGLQEGILLSQEREPANYHIVVSWRLESKDLLDPEKLVRAWGKVVARHYLLRAITVPGNFLNGLYALVILKSPSPDVIVHVGSQDEDDLLQSLTPAKFSHGAPRHRLVIVPDTQSHRFTVCQLEICHSIVDGISLDLLINDLAEAYHEPEQTDQKKPSTITNSAFTSYVEFGQRVIGRDYGREFWQEWLAVCEPTIFPQLLEGEGAISKPSCTVHSEKVDTRSRKELETFCSHHGVTLATLIRAVWSLILGWYTKVERPVFGYLVDGRDLDIDGIGDAIGPIIHMAVSSTSILQHKSILDELHHIQADHLSSLPYQNVPLSSIHSWLKLGDSALFNTVISMEQHPQSGVDDPIRIERTSAYDPTEYDIVVQVDTGASVEIALNYRKSSMDSQNAQIVARTFKIVLDSIISDPSQAVNDIRRSNLDDMAQVIQWNGECPPVAGACVHKLVEEQVSRSPLAMAVEAHDGSFTYQALNAEAFRLAKILVSHGVGPEVLVPVYLEKSKWAIVALLAVLKAGGGYVPLDPKHPESRIAEILELSSAKVAIRSASLPEFTPKKGLITIIVGQQDSTDANLTEINDLAPQVSKENVFCVMFTSGSTGKPKGVVLQHSNIATSAISHGSHIGFNNSTRAFQFATYTFDVSVMEIFTTLMFGGTVCVPSEAARLDDVAAVMDAMKVTWSFLTPTIAKMILPSQVPSLQSLTLGGEAVSKNLVTTWSKEVSLNMVYAPSECTVLAQMHNSVQEDTKPSSLGRPCGGLTWIVEANNHDHLAPIGVIGELVISGHIVGRGYLNDPERTSQAFIEKPLWADRPLGFSGPDRFYKTGDLVRYDADGNVQYIARKDTQVKLRGLRVELGEVEHHLTQALEGKALAVEIVQLPRSVNASLAAFVAVANRAVEGEAPQISEMCSDLAEAFAAAAVRLHQALPAYMVPSLFVPMTYLPQTLSGKTDRKELRLLASKLTSEDIAKCRENSTTKRAPTSSFEIALQELWAVVLNLDTASFGLDDSFFQLGGDSINAMRLVSKASDQGLQMTVQNIFQYPRMADMAEQITHKSNETAKFVQAFELVDKSTLSYQVKEAALQCNVLESEVVDLYPCTSFQEGLVAESVAKPGSYVAHYQFSLPSSIDIGRFEAAWEMTALSHPILRTRFVDILRHGIRQVVLRHSGIEWSSSTNLVRAKHALESMTTEIGQRTSKVTIIDTGEDEPRTFIWSIFHALIDGWSINLVLKDVMSAYQHDHLDTRRNLVEFRDFVYHTINQDIARAENFWSECLNRPTHGNFPKSLTKTPDIREPPFKSSRLLKRTSKIAIAIDRQPPLDITIATILKGAWALAIADHSNSSSVSYGLTIAGRHAPISKIEDIVGPTISTVPIQVQVEKTISVLGYLFKIQEDATSMIPFEHLGLLRIQQLGEFAKAACGFESLLVIHPSDEEVISSEDGLSQISMIDSDMQQSYLLTVQVWLRDSGPVLEATYDHSLDEDLVSMILAHFETAFLQLNNIASSGAAVDNSILGDISLFNARDKKQIESWNKFSVEPIASNSNMDILLKTRCISTPSTLAVESWDGQFTFEEIDTVSSKLSIELKSLGVTGGVLVPLLFEKSRWFVIAAMAVWKAGGCYTPTDPSQPIQRLTEIISETCSKLVLASQSHAELALHLGKALNLNSAVLHDTILTQVTYCNASTSLQEQTSLDLETAVVIFTSGSTGKPKGVSIDHISLGKKIAALGKALSLGPESRVLQFSSYAWDAHLLEVWATIMHGGTVCVPSAEDRLNSLQKFVDFKAINLAVLTPTVSAILDPAKVPNLTTLLLAGEPVNRREVLRWSALTDGKVRIMNGYGPTEGCICATLNADLLPESPSDIGKALGGQAWIVNPENANKLTPVGCVGELLITGPSLARGYVNESGRSAEVFVESLDWMGQLDPGSFDFDSGKRAYRTGDLVRYTMEGSMQYIGRKDTQMKLRGLRIEAGEIEYHATNALITHKLNTKSDNQDWDSIVIVELVSTRLFASVALALFIQVDMDSRSSEFRQLISHINSELIQKVPSHMVPTLYVPVPVFPRSTSGKADRKFLQEMCLGFTEADVAQFSVTESTLDTREPNSTIEKLLSRLWSEVLNLSDEKQLVLGDDFLRLGGDSVAAMRLVGIARSQGLILTVSNVFQSPKLGGMASVASISVGAVEQQHVAPFSLVEGLEYDDLCDQLVTQLKVPTDMIADAYPCTPLQEGLMALSARQDGSYVARIVFPLPVEIDIYRFRAAWEATFEAIEVLRTRILGLRDSALIQVVVKERLRWSASENLGGYLEEDRKNSMQLGQPLVRLAITGTRPATCHFVLTIHHSLYDGWSIPLVLDRVEREYSGLSTAIHPPYRLFINHLLSADTTAAENFWTSQLDSSTASKYPPLPSALYQPLADATFCRSIPVSRKLDSSISISTILRAAWAIVLSQYTGSKDVVFGSTLSGRNAPVQGIFDIAGPTITTVPIRIQLDANRLIPEYLLLVQGQAVSMIPFEHTGLQNIKRFSMDAEAACGFQTLLIIQPEAAVDIETSERSLRLREFDSDAINTLTYGLTIECDLDKDGLNATATYDSNLIDRVQIDRILRQYEYVINQLAEEQPTTSLGEIEVINAEEKHELLSRDSETTEIVSTCVHELIERQMASRPEAIAVDAWDGTLTYEELDRLTSRLASYLRQLGVGPEIMVPLCFEHSKWAIVAMLGIVKAGGAFVPFNTSSQTSRLKNMSQQMGAKLILASAQHSAFFGDFDLHVVTIDQNMLESLDGLKSMYTYVVRPQNPVYVLFTSGSTGEPKGAVLEHQAVSTATLCHGKFFNLGPHTRFLQFASYTFDITITEIIATLAHGGCVCVPSDADRLESILDFMNDKAVNTAYLTPSYISMYHPDSLPALKTLICGGEAIRQDIIDTWSSRVRLFNAYGPTECCVQVVATEITDEKRVQSLGNAIAGNIWIVDPHDANKLAPIGALGELLVDGPTLFRGYLGDKKKTDSAVVLNPTFFPNYRTMDRRVYKSGDLVRYTSEGTIAYVGRKDNQVKLRGQRLELGEIEYHMFSSGLLKALVVLLPKSGPLKERLVAVVSSSNRKELGSVNTNLTIIPQTTGSNAAVKVSDVKSYISDKLPPHMVPSTWITVDGVPFLASGKTDRIKITRWLESMDDETYRTVAQISMEDLAETSMTPMEEMLQDICCQILGFSKSQISLRKSFLSLGGDSISSMQMVSRCRIGGISLTVPDILRAKSLSELATMAKTSSTSAIFHAEQIDTPFDLLPIQKLHFAMHPTGKNHFSQSFLLRLAKDIPPANIVSALEKIIQHHSMLRARFTQNATGDWSQMIVADIGSSYKYNRHGVLSLDAASKEIERGQASLDIKNGPLLVLHHFDTDEQGQLLSLVAHHLIIDLVSWRIILQDLEEILQGQILERFSKPFPFQEWVKLQAKYNKSRQIKSATMLPFRPPQANSSYWGITDMRTNTYNNALTISANLSEPETECLIGNAEMSVRNNPVDVFYAAAMLSFSNVFDDRETPALFVEGHGREPLDAEVDLSRTVGWFTTIHPVHIEAIDGMELSGAIGRVKDVRKQIVGNGLPYFSSKFGSSQGGSESSSATAVVPEVMEIVFNYLGKYQQLERRDSILRQVPWGTISTFDMGPDVIRMGLFELSIAVEEGLLQLHLTYNRHMKHQEKISLWLETFKNTLQEAVVQLSTDKTKSVAYDFPLMSWKKGGMDRFINETIPNLGISSAREVENIYPCSDLQESMLSSQLRSATYYSFHLVWEVKPSQGEVVDARRLVASWQTVISHHPLLRTRFVESESAGRLFDQVVLHDAAKQSTSLMISSHEDQDSPEKLFQQPSIAHRLGGKTHQMTVYQTKSQRVFCKLEMSHAITDAPSTALLRDHLLLAYEGTQLPKSIASFADYISFVGKQSHQSQLSLKYWTTYLQGIKPCRLPIVKDKIPTLATHHRRLNVSIERPSEIYALCLEHGVTLSNFFRLAWACVLRSYVGGDAVCFGYLASVRDSTAADLREVIAPLFNLLVCRMDFKSATSGASGGSMVAMLKQSQEEFVDSLEYRDCPLMEVQKILGLDVEDGSPLFDTLVNSRKSIISTRDETTSLHFETRGGRDPMDYAIVLVIQEDGGKVDVQLDYWHNRVTDEQAYGVGEKLRNICCWILEHPEKGIESLRTLRI